MPSVTDSKPAENLSIVSGRRCRYSSLSWRSLMLFQTFTSTRLLPFQQPFAIRVQPRQSENRDEPEHRREPVHAERADGQRPREEKHRERVEDEKQERDQIERDGKLHPR